MVIRFWFKARTVPLSAEKTEPTVWFILRTAWSTANCTTFTCYFTFISADVFEIMCGCKRAGVTDEEKRMLSELQVCAMSSFTHFTHSRPILCTVYCLSGSLNLQLEPSALGISPQIKIWRMEVGWTWGLYFEKCLRMYNDYILVWGTHSWTCRSILDTSCVAKYSNSSCQTPGWSDSDSVFMSRGQSWTYIKLLSATVQQCSAIQAGDYLV